MSQQHHPDAIRYDNVRPNAEIKLTGEDFERYLKQASALQKLLADSTIKAKYKIELMFGSTRTVHGANPGVLSFWESGSKLHGGGDEKIYICPGLSLKRNECERPLLGTYNGPQGIVCPACGSVWRHDEVIGERLAKLSMQHWAEAIYKYFRILDFNCDIYLKYAPTDIRSVALQQKEKATWAGSQRLDKARNKRARQSYPLKNIIKDVNAGADVVKRFYAFLVA